jgi:hypothetical protein
LEGSAGEEQLAHQSVTSDVRPAESPGRAGDPARPRGGDRVLALQRAIGNRATTRLLQRDKGDDDAPVRVVDGKPKYLLVDPSDPEGDLDVLISVDEPLFVQNYIDNNIVNGTAWVNQDTGEYSDLTVEYSGKDKRKLKVPVSEVPIEPKGPIRIRQGSVHAQRLRFDYFQLGTDGFIYPMYEGKPVYDEVLTPNIVSMRSQLDEKAAELHKLRVLLYTAGAFANIMSLYGIVLGFHQPEVPGHKPLKPLMSKERVIALPRSKTTEPEILVPGLRVRRGGRTGYTGPREPLGQPHPDKGPPYGRTDPRVPGVKSDTVPGRVQSRINLRLGIRKAGGKMVEGSGFWYAWSKHGGKGPASKSQFIHDAPTVFNLLKTQHVVDTPARPLDNGNFVREVEFSAVTVGRLPENAGGAETSVMTVITDKWGNLVNTFPGTLSGQATL